MTSPDRRIIPNVYRDQEKLIQVGSGPLANALGCGKITLWGMEKEAKIQVPRTTVRGIENSRSYTPENILALLRFIQSSRHDQIRMGQTLVYSHRYPEIAIADLDSPGSVIHGRRGYSIRLEEE